ncbi:MAG TPA: hypothetical protein VNY07_08095 [Chthoniobacterales bacterium]|nr:hypothetical protein [Chthoniobacterales bacterium]
MAKLVGEQPAYAEAFCQLGMADATLGHKEDAIHEGAAQSSCWQLQKYDQRVIGHRTSCRHLHMDGREEQASKQLAKATKIPGDLNYGQQSASETLCL